MSEPLNEDNLNPCLLKAEYAVRGAIAVKSSTYQSELVAGEKLPFNKVLQCNIGEWFLGVGLTRRGRLRSRPWTNSCMDLSHPISGF